MDKKERTDIPRESKQPKAKPEAWPDSGGAHPQLSEERLAKENAGHPAIETANAMGESVALLDLNGTITNANHAFAALAEQKPENLIGMDIRRLLPEMAEENYAEIRDTLTQVTRKASPKDPADALRIRTIRGGHKWVIPSLSWLNGKDGQHLGQVLALRDVSALIRTQEKLKESERKYRELVENANSIIMRITPDLRITFFNEYGQTFFGYPPEEIIGKPVIGALVPEVDSEGRDMRARLETLTNRPEENPTEDMENQRKDGQRVWIHWSNRAVRDAQGRVKEILCIGTDITQRKQLERQANLYHQRLRKVSERLAATEEQERRRVSTHLHDTVIQTLSLGNIRLGGVRKALEEHGHPELSEKIDQVRRLLDNGISECRGLMADLTPPLLHEVGLVSALQEFAATQETLPGQSISVEAAPSFHVQDTAHRSLLFHSTRELVMNALKHAGAAEIRIRLWTENPDLCIEVSDTGKGFDANREDLFHADHDGGYGLFHVRDRLGCMGGRIEIDSAPGQGTTARIHFPR